MPAGRLFRVLIKDYGFVFVRPQTADLATFREIFLDREFDVSLRTDIDILLNAYVSEKNSSGNLFVDIGGNVGFSAVYFYIKYPWLTFVIVEPDQSNFDVLIKNVEKSNVRNVFMRLLVVITAR